MKIPPGVEFLHTEEDRRLLELMRCLGVPIEFRFRSDHNWTPVIPVQIPFPEWPRHAQFRRRES